MKILLTHFCTEQNKGDAAITNVMLRELAEVFPKAQFVISAIDNYKDGPSINGARKTNSFFSIAIYSNSNKLYRAVNTFYVLTSTFLWTLIYRIFGIKINILLTDDLRDLLHHYTTSDLIVPVGGGYLRGKNNLHDHVSLIIGPHSIFTGIMLGKTITLYSQSIGPFGNRLQRFLVSKVLNRTHLILAREDITIKTITDMGVDPKLIKRSVDAAFLYKTNLKNKMKDELHQLGITKTKKLVGITVRKWLSKGEQIRYEREMAKFADYLISSKEMNVVFVPQTTADGLNEDDRVVGRSIRRKMQNTNSVWFLEKAYSHNEIKAIYENLDYLVGTRMHSNIFALTGDVPALAIAYEHKTQGIMKDLGLYKWVTNMEHLSCNTLISKFNSLKKSRKEYLRILNRNLPKYLNEAHEATALIHKVYMDTNRARS